MKHIHPFPARMAPDIALERLRNLPKGYRVLDPMSGSGMVVGTAAKLGLEAYGYDLDPLACLISKTNSTLVKSARCEIAAQRLLDKCQAVDSEVVLPWIDGCRETQQYIDFWFAPKQQAQLRALSYHLVADPFVSSASTLNVLKIAVSRLIITKEPKASLARDTAHSRPHRTIASNDFDVLDALPKSLDHVLKALAPNEIQRDAKAYRGDARRMGRVRSGSIDCIVTSPPYLNAIDYMRGHRLALVWLGYDLSSLRKLRQRSVGAERMMQISDDEFLNTFLASLPPVMPNKTIGILRRYYRDLVDIMAEAFRVLKPDRTATYVIGDSLVRGHHVANGELLKAAAMRAGFQLKEASVREIPENRRYMPLRNSGHSALRHRMRSEHVMTFVKAGH